MGYHVAILRTGQRENKIREDEIVSVVGIEFGFEIDRDNNGSIEQVYRNVSGEDVLLFYDGVELWAKTPDETMLKLMIDIANALGHGARVRGDEGETYESSSRTFQHDDDAALLAATKKFYWKNILSITIPVVIGAAFVYVFGRLLLRYVSTVVSG